MWSLGSVDILQPDVRDVAGGMRLPEVRHDLGSHTDGPGIYLSLWAIVMHDAPGTDINSSFFALGIPISSAPAHHLQRCAASLHPTGSGQVFGRLAPSIKTCLLSTR